MSDCTIKPSCPSTLETYPTQTRGLEDMDYVTFGLVLKNLSLKAKKNLRLVSHSMKEKVEKMDRDISVLTARSKKDIEKIMNVSHVKGIRLILKGVEALSGMSMTDEAVCKLMQQSFPLLKSLKLGSPGVSRWRLCFSNGKPIDLIGEPSHVLESLTIYWNFVLPEHFFGQLLMKSSKCLKSLKICGPYSLELPKCLSDKMTRLTKLVMASTAIPDHDFGQVLMNTADKLEILELKSNNVTGEALQGLQVRLDNLQILELLDNKITDIGLREFIRIGGAKLTKLFIAEQRVSGEGLVGFSGHLDELRHLNVVRSSITVHGLSALMRIVGHKLKYLTLPQMLTGMLDESPLQYPKDKNVHVHISFREGISLFYIDQYLYRMLQMYGQHMSTLSLSSCQLNFIQDNLNLAPIVLSALEVMNLGNCELSDAGLSGLLAVTSDKLKRLNLSETKITGESLVELRGKFINLIALCLSQCERLTDQGLCNLLTMCGPRLLHLDLSLTKVSGAGLAEMNLKFPNIIELYLTCSKFTDNGLKSLLIACGQQLKRLILEEAEISGEELFLDKKFQLSELALSDCCELGDKGLQNMLMICGNRLKRLCLADTKITGENLPKITQPWLQSLILCGCQHLTTQGLCNLISMSRKSIKYLDLSGLTINGEELAGQDLHLPQLEFLDIVNCHNLTSVGFCEILRIFGSTLKELHVSDTYYCGKILNKMPRLLKNLTRLNVGCYNVSSDLNSLLRTTGGKLKHLYVSDAALALQTKYIPNCTVHINKRGI